MPTTEHSKVKHTTHWSFHGFDKAVSTKTEGAVKGANALGDFRLDINHKGTSAIRANLSRLGVSVSAPSIPVGQPSRIRPSTATPHPPPSGSRNRKGAHRSHRSHSHGTTEFTGSETPPLRPRLAPGLLLRTTYLRRYRSKLRRSSCSLGPAVTDKERPSTSVLANNPPLDEIVLPFKRRNLPRTVLPVMSSSGSDA
ncbi:hypothetical protein VTN00DRAFT_2698 [Thermoascus crustaceus]|uniref:uncharacterized protein n=1 Tax=Thermoascus crustaceus TaxID=5088 RepID=UPI0037440A49